MSDIDDIEKQPVLATFLEDEADGFTTCHKEVNENLCNDKTSSAAKRMRGWFSSCQESAKSVLRQIDQEIGIVQLIALILCLVVICTLFFRGPRTIPDCDTDFRDELCNLEKQAWMRMLGNIGPSIGAKDGLVVASPSDGRDSEEPDYMYTWTRDSALTMSTILPALLPPKYLRPWSISPLKSQSRETFFRAPIDSNKTTEYQTLLEPLLRSYVSSQIDLQSLETPSGDLWTGGLNEPKYHINGSSFTGSWGRPQRDGPALRALALIPYAHFLLDRGFAADNHYVHSKLYDPSIVRKIGGSAIKNDLEEVAHSCHESSFDLWEEVNGNHLFTQMMCYRALQAGVILAERMEDPGASRYYQSQANNLYGSLISQFWDIPTQSWRPTSYTNMNRKTRQHDCALPLTYVHAGGSMSWYETGNFTAGDPASISGLYGYLKSFEGIYKVNEEKRWSEGWVVGRYREDVYDGVGFDGGNPWFICALASAQMIYQAQAHLARKGSIEITNSSLPFWEALLPEQKVEGNFGQALRELGDLGDKYLMRAIEFIKKGRMSEQIDRENGIQRGARDLTWSYASLISAIRDRDIAVGVMRDAQLDLPSKAKSASP